MRQNVMDRLSPIPVIGDLARFSYRAIRGRPWVEFQQSGQYWEDRYRAGRDSGSGSHDRLARFKADVINDFVARNSIRTVIEFGCGDGTQLRLADYDEYVGIDVSETAIRLCRERFADDRTKQFMESREIGGLAPAELTLSLDVIYHLVEDEVFRDHMNDLFRYSTRSVVIYSSNRDGSWPAKHVKHRNFSAWIEQNQPDWRLEGHVENPYPFDPADPENTSFADFYLYRLSAR